MQVLIADDDALTAEMLEAHCRKVSPSATAIRVADGIEARKLLQKRAFDLVLLDLDLPGISGRDLIALVPQGTPVIIVTGDPAFAAAAFGHDVVDYLVKPVKFDRFVKAWKKLGPTIATTPSREDGSVFVRVGSEIVRLDLAEVRFIRSESNYVRFHLGDRELSSLMNMKDLELKLPGDFVRVHRSYIVNLRHIEKLDSSDIKVGRELIPVSDTYRENLIKRLSVL